MVIRRVLTIGGTDSSGGAGVHVDMKVFDSLGVHGCCAITCVTAQNTTSVKSIHPVPPNQFKAQVDAIFDDLYPDAIKTGMLYDPRYVGIIAKRLEGENIKIVVDPVLRATVGKSLSKSHLLERIKERLLPKAYLVTPNIHEASELVGWEIRDVEDMERACREISFMGPENVLIKGGDLEGEYAIDVFYDGKIKKLKERKTKRIVHGTGCAFSAYITAMIAKGLDIEDAIELAKKYITTSLKYSYSAGRGIDFLNTVIHLQRAAQKYHVYSEVDECTKKIEEMIPVSLIPEVGINMAFCLPGAEDINDVCGLDGRIISSGNRAVRVGVPKFGGSKHMATLAYTAYSLDRKNRCAMNIRYSPPLISVCKAVGLKVGSFDRAEEPKKVSTMAWGVESVYNKLGFIPDIIYDSGDLGKEPMIRILGEHPNSVYKKLMRIVKELKRGDFVADFEF